MSQPMMFFIVGIILLAAIYMYGRQGKNSISPSDAYKLIQTDTNVILLDVRTPAEFKSETGHLAHAILLPVQDLEQRLDKLQKYQQKVVIVYCRSGHRSASAAAILQKHGYQVHDIAGGITRWNAEQLPVVKDKS